MTAASFSGSAPGILIKDLHLRFGNRAIFSGINLEIPAGKTLAMLGASGCGKTSLLRIIAGLLNPDSGKISASDGLPIAGRMAWMGQRDLLYPWLSIIDNVMLSARLRGEKTDRPWAEYLLEQVGLENNASALPADLSGGMRQRAALARTLYQRAPLVLMDEPFSALDAITRATIQTLASNLLQDRTVVLITHDPLEACRLGHHLVVLGGNPVSADASHNISGEPPRAPDCPEVLRGQGELLRQLMRAAG